MFRNNTYKDEEQNLKITNKVHQVLEKERNKEILPLFFVSLGDDQSFRFQWNKKSQHINNPPTFNYLNDHNSTYPFFQESGNDSNINSNSLHMNEEIMVKQEEIQNEYQSQERANEISYHQLRDNTDLQPMEDLQIAQLKQDEVIQQKNIKLSMKSLTKLLLKIVQSNEFLGNKMLRQVYIAELLKIKPNISEQERKCALRRYYDIKNILITSKIIKADRQYTYINKQKLALGKYACTKTSQLAIQMQKQKKSIKEKQQKILYLKTCKRDLKKFINNNKRKSIEQQKLKLPLIAIALDETKQTNIIFDDNSFIMRGKKLSIHSDFDLILNLIKKQ